MTDVSERAAPPPPVDDCVYDPFYQFHGTPPATTTTTHLAENMCDKVTPGGLRITVKNTACRGDSTGGTADRVVVNSNISTPSSDVKLVSAPLRVWHTVVVIEKFVLLWSCSAVVALRLNTCRLVETVRESNSLFKLMDAQFCT